MATTDEILIRRLVWQNGLYRGMLTMTLSALDFSNDIDCDDRDILVKQAREVLAAPLPPFLSDEPCDSSDPHAPPRHSD